MTPVASRRDQLLSIVSHDFKNPLCAIALDAQLLLRQLGKENSYPFQERIRVQAKRILRTTDRLREMVEELLENQQTEWGLQDLTLEHLSLRELVLEAAEMLKPLAEARGIEITPFLAVQTELYGDKIRLGQVISNLLVNALKFSPDNSVVRVELGASEKELSLRVCDQGPGIAPEESELIFQKFWSTSRGGNSGHGLGLFICRQIIEAHGGVIQVSNFP